MLKLRKEAPVHITERLVNKHGYYVVRNENDYILFAKFSNVLAKGKPVDEQQSVPFDDDADALQKSVFPNDEYSLTQDEMDTLDIRCDNIVDRWKDPYNHVPSVRVRLHNMAQCLTLRERQYVLDFIEREFPLEAQGKK